MSANSPSKYEMIWFAVSNLVISPFNWITPGIGAISCKSTATILELLSSLINFFDKT